ncbi:MAG: hypothetical protein OXE73_12745 [Gammaproteobacteria bacterium]|nr:hypothetical protein [Gammaproteobacteria bacterium]
MRWFAVVAGLSALTACSILDGPTEAPTTASIVIGGPGPGPLTLVTSNQFVYIFDNFGNRREQISRADTSTVDPGYRADLEMGGGSRIFVSVSRGMDEETTPQVSLQLFVRDETICEVESVLNDEVPEVVCTYTFN